MKNYVSLIFGFLFVISVWFVGFSFITDFLYIQKRNSLIHEIHKMMGDEILCFCEDLHHNLSFYFSADFEKKLAEEKGYSYLCVKNTEYQNNMYFYNFYKSPWSIIKTVVSENGVMSNTRYFPAYIYTTKKNDYLKIDSILMKSYTDLINVKCPANVNDNKQNKSPHIHDILDFADRDPVFNFEVPKNDLPENYVFEMKADNCIIGIKSSTSILNLRPKQYIIKSNNKIRLIGCFVVALFFCISVFLLRNKKIFHSHRINVTLINILCFCCIILLWGAYYYSFVSVKIKEEKEAQNRLDKMFDEELLSIYPNIENAVKFSTNIKSGEVYIIDNIDDSYCYEEEVKMKVERYNCRKSIITKKIKVENIGFHFLGDLNNRISSKTDEDRKNIIRKIETLRWTIYFLMKTNPDKIQTIEDGKGYINETDSLRREVLYQFAMLNRDIDKLFKKGK